MITRDYYVALLEKRAMDYIAEQETDPVKATMNDRSKIVEDTRTQLGTLFDNTSSVQSNQTSEINKLFPGGHGTKQHGNALIKVARANFFDAVGSRLSPLYAEQAYRSFCDEIEKIASRKK